MTNEDELLEILDNLYSDPEDVQVGRISVSERIKELDEQIQANLRMLDECPYGKKR